MQIHVRNGESKVSLTKTEQRKLREAHDLAEALATHGQCSSAEDARGALSVLLAKYAVPAPAPADE